ncbi:MAG: TetR/AcrR family transcriptional regulator [Actinomycetes bacterium]
MPKIAAATVAENREQRKEALLAAAAALIQRGGGFTVAEVAKEVGLSRTAVYEYYSSAAELIADVLIDELAAWSTSLADSTDVAASVTDRTHAWITGVLSYAVDGRHALLRSVGTVELPESRRDEVQALHQAVIAPLVDTLVTAGSTDPVRDARFVWGVVDVAINRIESGECEPQQEISAVITFVDGALAGTLTAAR